MSDTSFSRLVHVDRDAGVFRVARRSFLDDAVFEAERSQIFDRCWLYVGHSSELAKKGAFVTRPVGGRNLIFNRDGAGSVRAFLNSCPHRGSTVCRDRAGLAKNFTCSYHGWVFGADGKMRDIPGKEAYVEGFGSDGCADLVAVPRLEQYRDFWFVCFDAGTVPLVEYLAGVAGMVIDAFRWPAEVTGIAPEIWAAGVACAILIALWRALGGLFD